MSKFLNRTHGTLGTPKTDRWPWEPIILSTGHFQGPSEVPLNNCRETVCF